jgi:recombinational DNA repair protein RecR
MITTNVRSALLVPHTTKQTTLIKTHNNIGKPDKHCINCGMMNHNVETCQKKKRQNAMAIIEATQPSQKPEKTSSYACHISSLNGPKMTNCPKVT